MVDLSAIPSMLPSVQMLAVALVFYLGGALAPAYYAQERFRGFGRSLLDRLPYKAPPGMNEEEALQLAVESAAEQSTDEGDDG